MKRQLGAVYYSYRDPRVGRLPRLIIMIALAYSLSPVDLIPDFIPVLGYLDDLMIVPALIGLAIRLIPAEVMADAVARAEKEPLTLRRNWFFGLLFVSIWVVAGLALVKILLERFQS
jgi:uncharacterized membrane protein YkvA (DUF1232 family)